MSVLEHIRAIRDGVPADQVVARAALGEVLTVLEGEEDGLREALRAAFGTATLMDITGRTIHVQQGCGMSVDGSALREQLVETAVLALAGDEPARPSLRAALIRMVDETYETHHTPNSESGPEEWDYTLSAPTIEAVEQALRALTEATS